jgi:UDP-GlcNAc3NAcA epimerase
VKKICSIIGARPQFVKASALTRHLRKACREVTIHTGQHYDPEMSDVFFDELSIPKPDYHLGIGSDGHGRQTGAMLQAIEKVLLEEEPDAVVVFGDTNSTLAGALAAVKLHMPVAHVEAGLRSFNRRMPEEINRVVADRVSTWLFAPSTVSQENLRREGMTKNVHVVGDIMYDAILHLSERTEGRSQIVERLGLDGYHLATIHRAENTDDAGRLTLILEALGRLDRPVVLPLHPRTRKAVTDAGLSMSRNISAIAPCGYRDMVQLMRDAECILTDSGGVQKEAYYLGVPCVTLRDETEWTETVDAGWNAIVGTSVEKILAAVGNAGSIRSLPRPSLYGDGTTAQKIVGILMGAAPKGAFTTRGAAR